MTARTAVHVLRAFAAHADASRPAPAAVDCAIFVLAALGGLGLVRRVWRRLVEAKGDEG